MSGSTVDFDAVCPFLMCLETEPHSHPVCPTCDAVNYGGFSCPTCREQRPGYDEQLLARLRELAPEVLR